jgi:hypothetical protein
MRNGRPPKALALPLIYGISARTIGSRRLKITPIPVLVKEPEISPPTAAFFGPHAMSDLSPECVSKRKSANHFGFMG